MKQCGHPLRLSDIGVEKDIVFVASLHAIADTPTLFNARPVTDPAQVAELYEEVF
jgi:alcohol dehydrogenase class IV